jgi:uncharacterized protein
MELARRWRPLRWAFLVVLALACSASADDAYRQSVEKWRSDYQATLTSDTGWLTVSGLFWLREGENTFGSDPSNSMVLPASAPAHAGTFQFHSGKIVAHINPGVDVLLHGKPVQTAELHADSRDDRLVLGDIVLWVHASGDRFGIRMRDKNSPLRKNFTGLHWFPVEESYHVRAQYTAYSEPKEVDSQNVLGDAIKLPIVGYLSFPLHGRNLRLEVEAMQNGGFFVVFRDLTAGKQTYAASRFIDTDPPQDTPNGKIVDLDFNKAYNPPCAYNPYTTCPLPVPGNRLHIPIPAGEMLYNHDHH